MTTGEKLALLRKKKGITQEELSDILKVSRQSISRWELDVTFPETDKLIKLSKLFECSIDFLLNENSHEQEDTCSGTSVDECCKFIQDCGYFFLATSVNNQPRLRPFGMIYSNNANLFFATDKRKQVYSDLVNNPMIEIATYNLHTRKWIRIQGKAELENSNLIKERMIKAYPILEQKYQNETEIFLVIYKLAINHINIT